MIFFTLSVHFYSFFILFLFFWKKKSKSLIKRFVITLHTVHASHRKDSLLYLSIYPSNLSIPTTKAFSSPVKKGTIISAFLFFFFLLNFFLKTKLQDPDNKSNAILYYTPIYIYKKTSNEKKRKNQQNILLSRKCIEVLGEQVFP